MVTFSPERGLVPLLKVALKVTGWLTAGVVFDAVRVTVVGIFTAMKTASSHPSELTWTVVGSAFMLAT